MTRDRTRSISVSEAYRDEQGNTPVLECIRRAERLLWETEKDQRLYPNPGAG